MKEPAKSLDASCVAEKASALSADEPRVASADEPRDGSAEEQPGASTHTLALTVAYRGAAFSGFARQLGQLTVQGELEGALGLLLRRPVETTCAGRTDAGVHARGQVVSFDVSGGELAGRTERSLLRSLNALTHNDISVRAIDCKPAGFSARFDAKAREYRYFFSVGAVPPVLARGLSWHVGERLDVAAMDKASRCLIGEHDFKSFCRSVSAEGRPTHRCVNALSFTEGEVVGEPVIVMRIVGNAFLHSMVRTIAGTLAAVGCGRREPSWVADALAACDRRAAGETAPACGLVFWEVYY